MAVTNDGTYLEDEAEKFLKSIKTRGFFWRRLYDAKTARNKFPAQPADFFYSSILYGSYHLECKSVGGRKPRLKKFSQWAGMRRWAYAGVGGLILVHFHALGEYHLVDVLYLQAAPSWLLTTEPYESVKAALWRLV